ncbi:YaiI/YqxD family protein [Thiomicrospira microaerophila]|uniref:YaiI/YqxD family protein n=1 Tax=Thiomicrospira microaerophila TaxID=406020 RepID=UPI00200C3CDE|nr:YaiI/YqxD family protein [Thiomicrospira microaerophila]UQB43301.1 YaiI/YqxD family protein [Thiomicrospira microaerophila]
MKIWVDADACPVVIKEILFKAAIRTSTETILVANHTMQIPVNPLIKFMQVPGGFDVADNKIMQQLNAEDLVITQDIPLAAEVVAAGALAINPRGELYTESNIKARLTMRDFMESLRSSGIQTGGPAAFNQADRQAFANQLDRILTQRKKHPQKT